MAKKRILFAGYAPVHFVCFEPVYRLLRNDPRLEIWLSGGYKSVRDAEVSFLLDGFYDRFEVDRERVVPFSQIAQQSFDVLVCAHLSDSLFPREVGRSVQIFHGVSFKNRGIREKALRYDVLCLPGRYHADKYEQWRLVRPGGSRCLVTGFPKVDALVQGQFRRASVLEKLGIDPGRPTLLYAPTGDADNSLETMGEQVVRTIHDAGKWNLLVKLHDHPKQAKVDWGVLLSRFENDKVRLVHDWNVVPYLQAADLLITDASSVAVEYTLLDRPVVFLEVPELLKKMVRKHAAIDMDTYGWKIGVSIKQADEALDAIAGSLAHPDRESEIRRTMAEHIFYKPGSASSRVAGVILHAAGLAGTLPDDVAALEPAPSLLEDTTKMGVP
jgi:hypothetical protein